MENKYQIIPSLVDFKILQKKKSLSPSDYITLAIKNKNVIPISKLINKISGGKEIGSKEYLKKSDKFFIRTKALSPDYYLIDYETEAITPIRPQAFIDKKLKEGDILLSKDSNIGEVAILEKNLSDYSLCGGIKIVRPIKNKYYLFAFLKSNFFKDQLKLMTPRGATLKHVGDMWLDAIIPFPNQKDADSIIEYLSLLVKSKIRKEKEIREKFYRAIGIIRNELKNNQKNDKFEYSFPQLKDLMFDLRIDAGLFCEDYKREQFLIENYRLGYKDIFGQGFKFGRGQNLQVSQIGRSIYSDEDKVGFYRLVRPTNLSDFGTIAREEYLGSPKELQKINRGEVIFSAEGTIGKFYIFIEVDDRTITNIHGITIYRENEDDVESAFLGLFLGYLRKIGVLDYISVGGQGGSLAQRYWNHIIIPNFPRKVKEKVSELYFIKDTSFSNKNLSLKNFEQEDIKITEDSGISNLSAQIKIISNKIQEVINNIINDEPVKIDFNF